jgi:hypothetical protein
MRYFETPAGEAIAIKCKGNAYTSVPTRASFETPFTASHGTGFVGIPGTVKPGRAQDSRFESLREAAVCSKSRRKMATMNA